MMTDKPQPVAYTSHEGGVWQAWKQFTPGSAEWRDPERGRIHSIKFDDGSVFDAVNGWRALKVA